MLGQDFNSWGVAALQKNDHEHKDGEKQFQSPGGASTSVSTFGVDTHLDWGKTSAYRWPARRPKVHMLIGTFWARTIQQRGGMSQHKNLRRCQGLCLIAAVNVLSNCCIVKHPPFEHPCGRGNSTQMLPWHGTLLWATHPHG